MRKFLVSCTFFASVSAFASDNGYISREELIKKLDETQLPYRGKDGKITGFKMLNVRPGSVYEKLGVKQGDVIVSTNGKPINSIKDAQETYSDEMNDVVVRRNGKEVRLKK